jgi:hypothetical protein
MSDTFKLQGEYSAGPYSGGESGLIALSSLIDESMTLANKAVGYYDLTSDSVQTVSFGGLASASVIVIKATGGKVKARLTSADGTTQAIPIDGFMVLMSRSVPYTALDLTRVAGTETLINVFLGQASA